MISTVTTVSTVTTTTASTVSTVTTAAPIAAGLGLISVIALIIMLIAKELAGASSENSSAPEFTLSGALDRVLNIGIIPLLMVFVSIVVFKIINIL